MLNTPDTSLSSGSAFTGAASQDRVQEFPLRTYNIQDILRGDPDCPVSLHALQGLIHAQARLHLAQSVDDLDKLRDTLESRSATVRGFVLWADRIGPLGYSIYFPMVDPKGSMSKGKNYLGRAIYAEDLYIDQSFVRYGLGKKIAHELAKRALEDNGQKLVWSTDQRNSVFKVFLNSINAQRSTMMSVAATDLLNPDSAASTVLKDSSQELTKAWRLKDLVTRMITPEDVNLVESLGMSPQVIRHNGDITFKGFVTYRKDKPSDALALTLGGKRLSTFALKDTIQLEPPVFAEGAHQTAIVASIVDATRKYAKQESAKQGSDLNLSWHIEAEIPEMRDILIGKLGLKADSMLGNKESEFLIYTLDNGALEALAHQDPEMVLRIEPDRWVGHSRRGRVANNNNNSSGLEHSKLG